jgi:hypothetical protein
MPPICKDPSINHLNFLGYSVVRLPREDITPLTVLVSNPTSRLTVTVYGHIKDIVVDPVPTLPSISENLQAATINGLKTSQLEFGLGITFLKTLLSALGGNSAGIEAAFKDAKQIEFEYNNVVYDTATPASVTKFLLSAKPAIAQWMSADFDADGKAYIVVEVLKSNSFSVRAFKEGGERVDIKIDGIKEVVGVESKLVIEKKEDLKIAFNGNKQLTFAVKVCPIWVEVVNGKSQFLLRPQTALRDVDVRGALEYPIAPTLDDEDILTPVLLAPNRLIQFA